MANHTLPIHRRSRLRFSLRTLFVVVTVVCIGLGWLAWNWQIVAERKDCLVGVHGYGVIPHTAAAPFPRNLFGDKNVRGLALPTTLTNKQVARVRAAYPEAKVRVMDININRSSSWSDWFFNSDELFARPTD